MTELDPRIKIRAPLRCDGIGRLDCAEDAESGMRLAVRWLPLEANGAAAIKACERLPSHPVLPRIRHTGAVGGSAFVALDFPEGAMLSTMLGERLENHIIIVIARQISDALATVHEQAVVHGEISSESILMVPGERAYLWDMPLVIANRLTDRRGENRLMQNLVKTAAYLAPERARGSGASKEADVYSFAAVLCVAAGAPLPTANTTLGMVHLVASGLWKPRVPSTLPPPVISMLERMLHDDPSKRPTARDAAVAFATPLNAAAFATVPEMPVVRLPMEMQKAAENAVVRPSAPLPPPPPMSAPKSIVVASYMQLPPAPPAVTREEIPAVTAETPVELVSELLSGESGTSETLRTPTDEVPEVAAADVVKLPTVEIPAVVVTTSEVVRPAMTESALARTSNSVPLTENVAVSPDLVQYGAKALPAGTRFPTVRMPSSAVVLILAMTVTIVVLSVIAFKLASRPVMVVRERAPRLEGTKQVEVIHAVPLEAEIDAEDELAPLSPPAKVVPSAPRTPSSHRVVPKTSRPKDRAVEVPEASAEPAAIDPDAVVHQETKPEDFGFLNETAADSSKDLKQPQM